MHRWEQSALGAEPCRIEGDSKNKKRRLGEGNCTAYRRTYTEARKGRGLLEVQNAGCNWWRKHHEPVIELEILDIGQNRWDERAAQIHKGWNRRGHQSRNERVSKEVPVSLEQWNLKWISHGSVGSERQRYEVPSWMVKAMLLELVVLYGRRGKINMRTQFGEC